MIDTPDIGDTFLQSGDNHDEVADEKAALRAKLRKGRRRYLAALPTNAKALMFHRPPRAVLDLIQDGAVIGLYRNSKFEAPTGGYARFFVEQGHRIALPYFTGRGADMAFSEWRDPFGESDLELGPFGIEQPGSDAEHVEPDVVFVPLLGFTESGTRLGQGGGHYDRWLAANPKAVPIAMAWDSQRVETLPSEAHDIRMRAVITPGCLYESAS